MKLYLKEKGYYEVFALSLQNAEEESPDNVGNHTT